MCCHSLLVYHIIAILPLAIASAAMACALVCARPFVPGVHRARSCDLAVLLLAAALHRTASMCWLSESSIASAACTQVHYDSL